MKQLHLLLFLTHMPVPVPEYLDILNWLRKRFRLYLTVINNGRLSSLPRLMGDLQLSYRTLSYPLCFHPAQIIAQLTPEHLRADTVLWLEDGHYWNPQRLLDWQPFLEQWTVIHPQFEDVPPLKARSAQTQSVQLQPSQTRAVPPCFCFERTQLQAVQAWLQPSGQMSIMLAGCDQGSQIYPQIYQRFADLKTIPELKLAEAQARWDEAINTENTESKSLALLQSLQRALPHSPAIYQALSQLITTPLALLENLRPVLETRLYHPELLGPLSQALMALGREKEAVATKDFLDWYFPDYRLSPIVWTSQEQALENEDLPPLDFPKPARLTGVLLIHLPDDIEGLPAMMADFGNLISQWIVVSTLDPTPSLPDTCPPVLMLNISHETDMSTLKNYGLADATGEWVLMLEGLVHLPRTSYRFLRRFLLQNPPGLTLYTPRYQAFDLHHQRHYIQWLPCLFPKDTGLNYHGEYISQLQRHHQRLTERPLPQIRLEGPLQWPHLSYNQSQKAQEPAPELLLLLGRKHYLNQEYTQAEEAYARAFSLLPDPPQSDLDKLWRLDTLLQLGQLETAEKWQQRLTTGYQDIPDYWYYKGQIAEKRADYAQAIHAFETCCDFQSQADTLSGNFTLEFLTVAPRLRLKNLYWQRALDPSLEIGAHQARLTRLRRIVFQLLKYFPDGEIAPGELNLYYFLVQVCIVSVFYQPGQRLMPLFEQTLPAHRQDQGQLFYARTALFLLEKKMALLRDRLPPQTGIEEIRELVHNPYYIHLYCKNIWERPELDGPEMARAFLSAATVYYRDISYALLLSGLLYNSGEVQEAHCLLKNTHQLFPDNAYLLHSLGRICLEQNQPTEAIQHLETALQLQPDFSEVKKLLRTLKSNSP